jgi:S-sulfo-L-cysteine synthase (O-acetyl-L-serine-dependent)
MLIQALHKTSGEDLLEKIGDTPLLRLKNIGREFKDIEFCLKAEWFNPGGSIKDRPASYMIRAAEQSGKLTKDKILLDSTSGNTGIAYAMVGASRGYRVRLVMPKNVSEERKRIVTAYGAEIIYSSELEGSDGAIRLAEKLYRENKEMYYMPDQYNNPVNPQAHYETTGKEIWKQTEGQVTHFLAGIGTGGTVMGTGRRLKEYNRDVQVIAVEPKDSWHGLEGMKHMATSIVPGIFKEEKLDGKIQIETEEAYEMVRRLGREEGMLVGQSSGAVLAAALKLAAKVKEGLFVMIFADGGDKYLSTRVWGEK